MTALFPEIDLRSAERQTSNRPRRRRHDVASRIVAQWELDDAIAVVLFAGLGGACQGLEEAGCPVQVANNHDDVALAAHAAMHPHTRHVKGDIFDVDPLQATGGRRVKILWALPDCRDHSVAKGGAPRSARVRSLPWQVCRWVGKTHPAVVFLENVREIRGWGPLVAKRCSRSGRVIELDGSVAAKGEHVPLREQSLVRDRKRLGRSFRRFVAHLKSLAGVYEDRDLNCADFGVPTRWRRYFGVWRSDGQPIRWPERTHAPRRQAAALGLLPHVTAASIIDWTIPLPSIFERKRPLADATQRRIAMGMFRYVISNPQPFLLPITHHGKRRVHPASEPLPTLTTAHGGELAVVAPMITKFHRDSAGASMEDPLPTVTANGHTPRRQGCAIPIGVVGATMIQTGYGERVGQTPRCLDIEEPIGTQVAGGAKHGIVGAFMAQNNFDDPGRALDAPVSTLATVGKQAVVAAWMAQHNLGVVGHEMTDPLSTLTTVGTQQNVTAVYLGKLRGTSSAQDATEPVPTLTAGGNHIAAVAAFMTKYYGTGGQAQGCDEALHTLTGLARFGVVTVNLQGQPYVVTDIGMRMLEPKEAAAAPELTLPTSITLDGITRPLTKTESMRLIGNSVPKRMTRLLAQANATHVLYVPSVKSRVAA